MRKFLLGLLFACVLSLPAKAQMVSGIVDDVHHSGAVGFQGAGDIVSGAVAYWALRCYNAAYAGNVADVFDSATGTTTHTLLTCSAGGTINQTINPLSATCAISCVISHLYNQSGFAGCTGGGLVTDCDFCQGTNSARPTLIQSGTPSGKLSMHFTAASSQRFINCTAQSLTSLAQPYTFSAVVRQATACGCSIYGDNNVDFYFTSGPIFRINAGTNVGVSTVVNTWYANQAVFNAASSVEFINGGSNSPGSPGTAATSASPLMGDDSFGQFMNGDIEELGVWPIGFNPTQQSNMDNNERTWAGF